jgi:hypothetical protein
MNKSGRVLAPAFESISSVPLWVLVFVIKRRLVRVWLQVCVPPAQINRRVWRILWVAFDEEL